MKKKQRKKWQPIDYSFYFVSLSLLNSFYFCQFSKQSCIKNWNFIDKYLLSIIQGEEKVLRLSDISRNMHKKIKNKCVEYLDTIPRAIKWYQTQYPTSGSEGGGNFEISIRNSYFLADFVTPHRRVTDWEILIYFIKLK